MSEATHLAKEISKESSAIIVLRDFDPQSFGESCLTFVCNLNLEVRLEWFRNFTRTLFLVGSPLKLCRRFPFDHISNDGSIGWISPSFPFALPLRRLLNSFHVDLPRPYLLELDLVVPGRCDQGKTWLLYLAVAGLSVPQCLVHLNHMLAEGVITGVFRAGHRIHVLPVPESCRMLRPFCFNASAS